MTAKPKVYREVEDVLRSSGLPWLIAKGKKHHHIYLDGRMIGVMSYGSQKERDAKMISNRVRRMLERGRP